ncbi:MAG: hypothetical protein MPL62_14750 [Alphaproteobacteria bacterium]|nr:hypothetical protein [Alphaproteobacteria bacterium]
MEIEVSQARMDCQDKRVNKEHQACQVIRGRREIKEHQASQVLRGRREIKEHQACQGSTVTLVLETDKAVIAVMERIDTGPPTAAANKRTKTHRPL